MNQLPEGISTLVDELSSMRGVVAVALGGSRAFGSGDPGSDWDLGLYYRREVDLTALAKRGDVHPPGSWGRVMNGGSWLRVDDYRVDVLLRDLNTVEHWIERAEKGEFEVDALLGYIAGAPTYILAAEVASCRVLSGALPAIAYPSALSASAPGIWRFCRSFSLAYARSHAAKDNLVGVVGQAAKAVMEEAHAVLCERGIWVCNEKRLIEAAGLGATKALFARPPERPEEMLAWIDNVASHLGASEGESMQWEASR